MGKKYQKAQNENNTFVVIVLTRTFVFSLLNFRCKMLENVYVE